MKEKNKSNILWLNDEKYITQELSLNVNTYDIDAAGHVNNIVYLRWLEDMRNFLFSQFCPLRNILEIGYYPMVAACEMKYKKSIKLFDRPVGRMFVKDYRRGIFYLKAEIKVAGKMVFTAEQKCVLVRLSDNKMLKEEYGNLFIKESISRTA
jgi:acyl-CoA thioester hydrolase